MGLDESWKEGIETRWSCQSGQPQLSLCLWVHCQLEWRLRRAAAVADGGLPGGGGRERRWDPGHPPRGTRSLALFLSDNTVLILKACRPHITVTTSLGFPSRLKTHSLCLAPAGQHCWVIFKMCKRQFAFSALQHFTVAYVVAFMFCTVQTHNVTKPATGLKG